MRIPLPLHFVFCLLLGLAFQAGAADEESPPDPGGEPAAAEEGGFEEAGGFGDDMFSLEPVDPDLPNKIRKWNAECYGCHSKEGVKHPPRDDLDLSKLAGLVMDSGGFDKGVHTGMACKECHAEGYVEYPHGTSDQRQIKPCLECHPQRGGEIEKEFKLSLHYEKHGNLFTCISCHEAHYMQVAEKIKLPREIALQDNRLCQGCHESAQRFGMYTSERELPILNLVHDWLPSPELHWGALRCVDCHTRQMDAGISHEILPKEKAEKNCVSCHSQDSTLRTRIYRYLVRGDRLGEAGFVNSFLLTDAYVVGATRNEWLDRASFVAAALVLAGIFLHAALRILSAALRGRKRNV